MRFKVFRSMLHFEETVGSNPAQGNDSEFSSASASGPLGAKPTLNSIGSAWAGCSRVYARQAARALARVVPATPGPPPELGGFVAKLR